MNDRIQASVSHEGHIYLFMESGRVFRLKQVRARYADDPTFDIEKVNDLPHYVMGGK